MRAALIICLGLLDGNAQVFPPTFWTPAASAGFTSPTSIGGMALYWNYNDLSQGATISNWVDRINAVAAHQPNSSLQGCL